jgi:LPXTG-site transpeptidase (sortase) family protein
VDPVPLTPADPIRLHIPALNVDAPVFPIAMTADRQLIPPRDPRAIGWWQEGAQPGASEGGAVLVGHTVHIGGGALDDLQDLRPGDPVVVDTAPGRLPYVVDSVVIYPKASLAEHAHEVFAQTGPGRLVVITCEDWNGQTYDSNTVVFASGT